MILLILAASALTVANGQEFTGEDGVCGTRPAVQGPQPRIFNGRDAPNGAWPWIGRVVPRPENYECMVALISDEWALTSIICGKYPEDNIVFGDNEVDGTSPYRQQVSIRRTYIHPQYKLLEQNDIRLLHLDAPVTITDYVSPICLSRITDEYEAYDNCWIAGWGDLNAIGELPKFLQEARTGLLPSSQCGFHDSALCGLGGTDGEPRICGDDAGAPMMCTGNNGRWYLVGQAYAYAGNCGENVSLFNRISYLADFIIGRVQRVEECSDPDYRCNNGDICVLQEEICDNVVHCPDGDDEIGCPTRICTITTCLNGGTCIGSDDGYICMCVDGVSGQNCEIVSCGLSTIVLTPGSSINLTSPLYPEPYPSESKCEYNVSVSEGYKVLAEIMDFDVERGFDFVVIDDTVFSGTNIPNNWTSIGESLRIRFTSDDFYQTKGFWIRLSAIDVTEINECPWNPCEFNGTCIDQTDGYSCECVDARFGRNCITPVDFCGPLDISLDADSTFNLTSFFYFIGNKYGAQYNCKYNVMAPRGYRIRTQFLDVSLNFPWDSLFLGESAFDVSGEEYVTEDNLLEITYVTLGFPGGKGISLVLSAVLVDVDECAKQPCLNGGICRDTEFGFNCKCRRGYTGKTCHRGLSRCGRNSFTCSNGRCIKAPYVCDGRNNCGDGSDELNCECEFNCYNGRCIPERYVCDGKNNCGDLTDELRPNC